MRGIRRVAAILFFCGVLAGGVIAGEPKIDCGLGAGEAPVLLEKLQVKVNITGPLAQTSLTMTFRNPHNRQLGGDLYFPLPEGASVSGYALDINGALVDGVVVTKEKARVVFEKEMRRRVDPGLVEWTKGNNFKTRVFPIPPNGTRTVRVDYVSELERAGQNLQYRLPLDFKSKLAAFTLDLDVDSGSEAPMVRQAPVENVELLKWQQIYRAHTEKKDALLEKDLLVALPVTASKNVYVEEHNGEYFFLADVISPEAFKDRDMAAPAPRKSISLVWDASASRAGAHEKELKFLRDYLISQPGLKLTLFFLRDTMSKPEEFTLTDAAAVDGVIRRLAGVAYDGGTALGALDFPAAGAGSPEAVLLFSDGIGSWGEGEAKSAVPVYAFSEAASTDFGALKSLCRRTGGRFLNLQTLQDFSQAAAVIAGTAPQLQVLGVAMTGAAAYGVYPKAGDAVPMDGAIRVVGRLAQGEATITLRTGYHKDGKAENTITVKTAQAARGGLLRRYWAQRKLEELLLDEKANEKAITELGQQYSIVTPGTSLIVLENLDQYVQYEIAPPESLPEMLRQYREQMAQRAAQGKQQEESKLSYVLSMWQQQIQWWEAKYDPASYKPGREKLTTASAPAAAREGRRVDSTLAEEAAPAAATQPAAPGDAPATVPPATPTAVGTPANGVPGLSDIPASGEGPERAGTNSARTGDVQTAADALKADEDAESPASAGAAGDKGREVTRMTARPNARIDQVKAKEEEKDGKQVAIKEWDPKAPYLEALKEADAANREGVYLSFRARYGASPAFYLDCANFFYGVGARALANRILSNIPELELENAALLRVAAYRLLDAKEYGLALALLREVKKMRAEEPQSWRDLALALADCAQNNVPADGKAGGDLYREALELLKHVVMNRWDRFEGIEVIALTEYNRILPLAEKVGLKREETGMDPRLIRLLDMDIRVTMSWDADLTDIDLHVVEPSGEEVFYGHNLSAAGGKVSRDFTQGYGPETYDLRRALVGKYMVKANYYGSNAVRLLGPVTLRLEIFTNYGRESESRQSVTLRLNEMKGMLNVAEITR